MSADANGRPTWRKMVYRAHKRADGVVVCVDSAMLEQTTKIVTSPEDLTLALSLGWSNTPTDAMERYEQEQMAIGNAAVQRVEDDQRLSPAAQAEVAAYEKTVPEHVVVMPEKPKRGRPRKVGAPEGRRPTEGS